MTGFKKNSLLLLGFFLALTFQNCGSPQSTDLAIQSSPQENNSSSDSDTSPLTVTDEEPLILDEEDVTPSNKSNNGGLRFLPYVSGTKEIYSGKYGITCSPIISRKMSFSIQPSEIDVRQGLKNVNLNLGKRLKILTCKSKTCSESKPSFFTGAIKGNLLKTAPSMYRIDITSEQLNPESNIQYLALNYKQSPNGLKSEKNSLLVYRDSTKTLKRLYANCKIYHRDGFIVGKNKLYDPKGKLFHFRGVSIYDYLLNSSSAHGKIYKQRWDNRELDYDRAKALGFNSFRVSIKIEDHKISKIRKDYIQEIVDIVTNDGTLLILQLSEGYESTQIKWLKFLGKTYKNNPYVMIKPLNEPFVNKPKHGPTIDHSNRLSAPYWKKRMERLIRVLRGTGYKNPILLNGTKYSGDLRRIIKHIPKDPLNNLILGAHYYYNTKNSDRDMNFDRSKAYANWSQFSSQYPVLLDETGFVHSVLAPIDIDWNADLLKYVDFWMKKRGGLGAIAFTWHGGEPSQNSDSPTGFNLNNNIVRYKNLTSEPELTAWGSTVYKYLLIGSEKK